MTCQHCQTEVLDGEHRCSRCARRVRVTPLRTSLYSASNTATASAYDFAIPPEPAIAPELKGAPAPSEAASLPGQQALFATPVNEPRVIPFESLTTPGQKESIRARAAELRRPAPLKTEKVEVRHARPRRTPSSNQRRLDFLGEEDVVSQPQSSIICDAPVAPASLRIQAALIDSLLILPGMLACFAIFRYLAGHATEAGFIVTDKHTAPFLLLALVTVPLFYKAMWTLAGRDSVGMSVAGLRLVDFDGNPPVTDRRYYRFFGSIISLLAAGMGLLWVLVDEDRLSWHDHMSGTFPTILPGK